MAKPAAQVPAIAPPPARKRKQRAKLTAPPAELRELVMRALRRGSERAPMAEFVNLDGPHWYVTDEEWRIPSPGRGGAELVFTALIGPIHSRSQLVRKCNDPTCVNPNHFSVMERTEAKQRREGTWLDRTISVAFKVVTKAEVENSFADEGIKQRAAQLARERKSREKIKAARRAFTELHDQARQIFEEREKLKKGTPTSKPFVNRCSDVEDLI